MFCFSHIMKHLPLVINPLLWASQQLLTWCTRCYTSVPAFQRLHILEERLNHAVVYHFVSYISTAGWEKEGSEHTKRRCIKPQYLPEHQGQRAMRKMATSMYMLHVPTIHQYVHRQLVLWVNPFLKIVYLWQFVPTVIHLSYYMQLLAEQ